MYPATGSSAPATTRGPHVPDPKANERSTVPASLEGQERALSDLHRTIDDFEGRLCGVLGPTGPNAVNATQPPPPGTIMQRVDLHTRLIVSARMRLTELMSRLEL